MTMNITAPPKKQKLPFNTIIATRSKKNSWLKVCRSESLAHIAGRTFLYFLKEGFPTITDCFSGFLLHQYL